MATRPFGVWGIDMGQCALKAIRLEMKDGQVVATAFEYIEHPKILSQPDADPDELTRDALTQFLSRNSIRGDLIAISVSGQNGLARFVKLPPVDQKKVAEIVKFEAKQQIPFPLEEVVWDFQSLSTGEVVDGMALETEIGLFAMKRDSVNRAVSQFKEVNIEVHLVQMAPLALCNFVAYDLLGKDTGNTAEEADDEHACIVALEIGTDSSNLVITDGARIIWQRPIPIGGNHFTRALTKELKLTFAKAEHLKRNAAKSPELKKILTALKQVLNDFVGEVQRSLGYFTNTHRNAQIQSMIGLGNAFRLPGLQKFLQEKLQLEVHKLTELNRASGESVTAAPTFAENIMTFAVPYGLALQGLKQARLQTNLLPHEVRLERMVRGKKPWAVTAAACLLFGLFLLTYTRGMEKSSVDNAVIKTKMAQLVNTTVNAKKLVDAFKKQEDDMTNAYNSLDRIGGGLKERKNWQSLHEYVNFAMPQPNGDRLVERAETPGGVYSPRRDLWKKDTKAQDAFGLWQEQQLNRGSAPIDPIIKAKDDEIIKKHLIQINLVGVNALYSEDLWAYFRKIHKDGNQLDGMNENENKAVHAVVDETDADKLKAAEADPEKAKLLPPKEGWVVEVRGYTYHEKPASFVRQTFIENLKKPSQFKNAKEEPLMTKEMIELVENRVGYLNVYKIKTEQNPVAGKYTYIGGSYLKTVIKGEALKPGENPGGGGAPKRGGQDDAPKAPERVNRELWQPLGESAQLIAREGQAVQVNAPVAAQPAPGGDKKADKKPAGNPVERTEFVLLFVWQERIAAHPTSPLSENK
jgi:type IV pilus assembly protein PilM